MAVGMLRVAVTSSTTTVVTLRVFEGRRRLRRLRFEFLRVRKGTTCVALRVLEGYGSYTRVEEAS
jgi:hypothetical protein